MRKSMLKCINITNFMLLLSNISIISEIFYNFAECYTKS
jgi:hypothetical protein